jgi:hypothetical protein
MERGRNNVRNRRGCSSRGSQSRSGQVLRACRRTPTGAADGRRVSALLRRYRRATDVGQKRHPIGVHVERTGWLPEGARQRPSTLSFSPRRRTAPAQRDGRSIGASDRSTNGDGRNSGCLERTTRANPSRRAGTPARDGPRRTASRPNGTRTQASQRLADRTGPPAVEDCGFERLVLLDSYRSQRIDHASPLDSVPDLVETSGQRALGRLLSAARESSHPFGTA